jgi:hypothetical protein
MNQATSLEMDLQIEAVPKSAASTKRIIFRDG